MLQQLNERVQGLFAWVIISLVAITFAMFGIEYYLQTKHSSYLKAEVNHDSITIQDYELHYRRAERTRAHATVTQAEETHYKQQILDDMILKSIALQSASKAGFLVSDKEADTAILNIPQFQKEGRFSAERYQQALSGALYTPGSFLQEVKQGMLLDQQRFAFMGTSFAMPNEVAQFVKLYMQTRDYDYLIIPAKDFLKQENISDAQIQAYYDAHRRNFVEPEKVSVEYLLLSMKSIKNAIKLSDNVLKQYYEQNKESYRKPTEWQVQTIQWNLPENVSTQDEADLMKKAGDVYNLLKNDPQVFDKYVKKSTQDNKEGKPIWITAGQTPLDETLMQLKNKGDVSSPVKVNNTIEIFKLVDYKPAVQKPFQDVKADIENQLLVDKAQEEYSRSLEKLTDLSYQAPDSLEPAAKELNLPIIKTPFFTRNPGLASSTEENILKNNKFLQTAFSHDVLEEGLNSEPFQLNDDSIIVLRLNNRVKEKSIPLNQVRKQIINDLAEVLARARVKQLGESILVEPSIQDNFLKNYHFSWHSVSNSPRESDKIDSTINTLAFKIPKIGTMSGQSLANGDFALVKLQKIQDGQVSNLDAEQVSSLTQQIESTYGTMDYDLYIEQLREQAKIVTF